MRVVGSFGELHTPVPLRQATFRDEPGYRQLYFYVLVVIVLGVGSLWPGVRVAMKPIGTAFVGLG